MKKIILGIVLIAISGVIAWNGAGWADGQYFRELYLFLIGIICFVAGFIISIVDYINP